MPERPVRKRRPDKRKTYWAFQTAHVWRLCRDREKHEKSGIVDEQDIRWSIPDLKEIARVTRALRLAPEYDRGLGEDYFSAQRMVETKRKLELAIEAGKIVVSKRGVRAADIMKLWPSKRGVGVQRSAQRTELSRQFTKIILTESRPEHRAVDRDESKGPHTDDLRRGKRPAFVAEAMKDALEEACKDVTLHEALENLSQISSPSMAKIIAKRQIAFLSPVQRVLEGSQPDLETKRGNLKSWSRKGRLKER